MLSICIPTYNTDITQLVNTLMSQAVHLGITFEILVYEDGSTDFLENNMRISSFEQVTYKPRTGNIGRTATRNELAKDARFDWLLLLDADVKLSTTSFTKSYSSIIDDSHQIIFGGVTYESTPPQQAYMLRWKYGHARESQSPSTREQNPHFIISQNLLIRKNVFLDLNNVEENRYGLDNYFSSQIKTKQIRIKHIDNPVIHLGLENSASFLKKGIKAAQTLVYLEQKSLIELNLTPLQRAYRKLKKARALGTFKFIIGHNKNSIEKNLKGKKPSLKLYDSYRLYHYIKAKEEYATA